MLLIAEPVRSTLLNILSALQVDTGSVARTVSKETTLGNMVSLPLHSLIVAAADVGFLAYDA